MHEHEDGKRPEEWEQPRHGGDVTAAAGTGPEIGILGPLVLRLDDAQVPIGRVKQRALLALLATEAGRTVSVDRMIDELWGDEPPARATASLQAYVSNLRRLLEPSRGKGLPAKVLVTEPPGYRLDVPSEAVDASRFETLAASARDQLERGAPAEAFDAATQALGLWRGPALEEFRDDRFAIATVARLEELRRACEEDRLAAMVELRLFGTAVAELEGAVRDEPLREARWALLMRALYATGRHADALDRFQQVRRLLGDELGLDPGPALVALEGRILAHDPTLLSGALDGAARGTRSPAPHRQRLPVGDTAVDHGTADARRDAPGVVEREAELAAVDDALSDVVGGRSRILVIEGEAGMGKTTLVRALAARAASLGLEVAWGACHDDADTPALWPWIQALRALDIDVAAPPGSDVFGHLDSLAGGLTRRSLDGPVVCVLEDLHWADPTSLRMLSFLSVELHDSPVLVVVTARSDEARAALDPAVAAALRHPGALHLPLRPLTPDGTQELAHAVAGGRLPATPELHVRTGGNPLFVAELARLLAAEGEGAGIPPGVREVIARRLGRLPEDANSLLVLAAVAGDDTGLVLLAAAAGMDVEQVADALDAAVAAGVLRIAPTTGRVSFDHAVFRDAVLDPVSDLQRRRLHARLARTWAGVAGARAAYERARHAAQAVPMVAPTEAFDAATAAARTAEAESDHGTAAHWWSRALDLVDSADDLAADRATRGAVLLSLAGASHRNGADSPARAAIIEALDDAADRGDHEQATAAVVALGATGGIWMWVNPAMDPAPLIRRVERVAAAIDDTDLPARSLVLGTLALGYVGSDPLRCDALSTESLELARLHGDPALVGRALSVRWRALWRPGRYQEQLAIGRELDDLARRLDDGDLQLTRPRVSMSQPSACATSPKRRRNSTACSPSPRPDTCRWSRHRCCPRSRRSPHCVATWSAPSSGSTRCGTAGVGSSSPRPTAPRRSAACASGRSARSRAASLSSRRTSSPGWVLPNYPILGGSRSHEQRSATPRVPRRRSPGPRSSESGSGTRAVVMHSSRPRSSRT